MSTSVNFLGSLLAIEKLMRCELCDGLVKNARTLNECGHRFCNNCIYHRIGTQRQCPTCRLPAIVKNMRPDPMHDTLVACVQKLKKLVNEQQFSQDSNNDEFAAPHPLTLEERAQRRVAGSSSYHSSPRDAILDEIELPSSHEKNKRSSVDTSWNSNYSIDVEYQINSDEYIEPKPEPLSLSLPKYVHDNDDANSDDEILLDNDLPADEQYPPPPSSPTTTLPTNKVDPTITNTTHDTQEDEEDDDLHLDDDLPDDERYYPIPSNNSILDKHIASNNQQFNTLIRKRSHHDKRPLEKKEQPCTPIPPSTPSPLSRQLKRLRSISPSPTADNNRRDKVWKCNTCDFQNGMNNVSCVFCKQPRGDAPENDREERMCTLSIYPSTLSTNAYQSTQCSWIDDQVLSYATQDVQRSSSSSPEPTKMVHVMFTGMSNDESQACIDLAGEKGLHMQIHQDTRNFDNVTHLVTTQDEQGLSPRTEKYLRGILAGKWIVNRSWIRESSEKGKWLAEEPYEIMGDTVAGKTHGPRRARQAFAEDKYPLFDGIRFCFFGKQFPNRDKMMHLCNLGGGHILARRPPADKNGTAHDHDLTKRSINKDHVVIIIHEEKRLNTKILASYQVRQLSWMLDCISCYARPVTADD
ncbi:hypothetical protein K492DRAFT_194202 [Lichtheimia hyalospora FSU 10163]|nr:hypothetical protein K492DRAFT_194202 [Lichtheimia hyalospora FSU 10163]